MTYEEYIKIKEDLHAKYDDVLRLAENKRHVLETLIEGLKKELRNL